MKTKSILFFILLFNSTCFFSQSISFGVKAGLNLSNQNFEYDERYEDISTTTSFSTLIHIGLYSHIPFSQKIGFQPEILYSREGSKIRLSGFGDLSKSLEKMDFQPKTLQSSLDFKQTVSYINVPLLLSIKPFNNRFSILTGPQLGFLVKDEINIDIDDGDGVDTEFKSFSFSGVIGMNYEILKGLSLGARYNFGLSNVSKEVIGTIKNNTFQIYLGYKLY